MLITVRDTKLCMEAISVLHYCRFSIFQKIFESKIVTFLIENRPLFHYPEVTKRHFPKQFLKLGPIESLSII